MDSEKIKHFLKLHSLIPNSFIDEFIDMNPNLLLQTEPFIDLDVISKWLGVAKFNLTKTLKTSYKEGIDYLIEKKTIKKIRYGGNHYKRILLTPDCFKRLCMLSKAKKAEEVRSYYIQLEALIFKYHQQMLDGMQQEIDKLEKALKPQHKKDHAGYIYILRADKDRDSVYKIGRTSDLSKRLATYQSGKLEDIEVVYKYRTENLKATEACVKLAMKERQYRKYKELYQADLQMIKEVIGKCCEIDNIKQMYVMRKSSKMQGGYYIALQQE
jgi:phage anti-repressor protein/predicted GIY-YIG superfamily endonuclease